MKKLLLIINIIILVLFAYFVGMYRGEQNVINNQIITNENHDTGDYISLYNDDIYFYWYE